MARRAWPTARSGLLRVTAPAKDASRAPVRSSGEYRPTVSARRLSFGITGARSALAGGGGGRNRLAVIGWSLYP
jgi:hypothetical protein